MNTMPLRVCAQLSIFRALACLLAIGLLTAVHSQALSNFDRERARNMLRIIKTDIAKNYYDSNFRGVDLEARFKEADEKIKQATSLGQVFGIIAQAVLDLNDSHTYFMPPQRASRTDYGWQMQMIGDKCYVVAVKPGSDAEAKGLKVGDEIYSVSGYAPARENFWKMKYLYYRLRPQAGLRVEVLKSSGQSSQLELMAKVTQGKRVMDLTGGGGGTDLWELIREAENEDRLNSHRYYEMGEDLTIWKMPQFDLDDSGVDKMMETVRKRKALILDLRGNGGGAVVTLQRLVGHFFDHDLKIADLKGRKEMKPMIAKTRGDRVFTGKLVVLVDSESGSASELFARVTQLEKRGTVVGDRTAGAVMRSRFYDHEAGVDTVAFYGVSVTDADVVMADGKSLEHTGVTPDELLLPTSVDLGGKRDPVMARAAAIVGVTIDPEKAGSLFPIQWRK